MIKLINMILFISIIFFILSKNVMAGSVSNHFTFIHSAWMGGWQWKDLAARLDDRGYISLTPDLPGHGQYSNIPASKITFDSYVDAITEKLSSFDRKTILVGHSFGGIIASQVAERIPEKVSATVYLCAFMLPHNTSFMDAVNGVKTSEVLNNLVYSKDGSSVNIKENKLHEAVAHDVPVGVFNDAKPALVPEPTAPLGYRLSLSKERYGSIPRYYIECNDDRAIPINIQKSMQNSYKVEHVYNLKSSHVPFFSMPDQVTVVLDDIAKREKARILSINARNSWVSAFNVGDAKSAASVYEPNAVMKAEPFATFYGRDAIQKFWAQLIKNGANDAKLFDTNIKIIDAENVHIMSKWSMNQGGGVIRKAHWVMQEDGNMLLREGHFTMDQPETKK